MMFGVDMLSILPWVLPPLLGAVIGFLTNALAIRMLFRPLRPWRFLGIPIPLTPGIIPRRRGELAENIGTMVARELLTTEVFAGRFEDPHFGRSLQTFAVRAIDRVGEIRVRTIRDTLPVDQMIHQLDRHVATFTDSIAAVMADIPVLQGVSREQVDDAVRHLWPEARRSLEQILRSPAVQAEMHVRARRILHYSLDQLTSLQRLFVSAAQYDRQLESRIPAIVDRSTAEILGALDSSATREGIIIGVYEWIARNHDQSLADLVGENGVHSIVQALQRALRLGDPKEDSLLVVGIRQWLHRHQDEELRQVFPVIRLRRAAMGRWIAHRTQATLSRLTPDFLAELNIHGVVVDRIEGLDIERVEGLLLGIMQRHLKWINVFGAFLGALIGGVQILLRFLGLA
jgi:uncharacterized membrane protein YheB (UPF0754 family)